MGRQVSAGFNFNEAGVLSPSLAFVSDVIAENLLPDLRLLPAPIISLAWSLSWSLFPVNLVCGVRLATLNLILSWVAAPLSQHHGLGVSIPECLKQKDQEFKASPDV